MTAQEIIGAAQDAILTIIVMSAPVLIVGTIVAVLISLIQALTQIQEMTISFVPKILTTFLVLSIAAPFMADAARQQFIRSVATAFSVRSLSGG